MERDGCAIAVRVVDAISALVRVVFPWLGSRYPVPRLKVSSTGEASFAWGRHQFVQIDRLL